MSTPAPPVQPEDPERPSQSVTDTRVYGHLVQISQVEGNVTIRLGDTAAASGREAEQIVEGDIPQQPRGFQLRQELLERLHGQVAATGAAVVSAVTGKPGVGKTMLAASYAWSCQAAGWPLIAWVAAETVEQIQTGLAGLAERLGLRRADDDAPMAARRARDWLSATSQPSLVVFDNATQVEQVRAWCPATGAARVVITSRNRAFERAYAPVPVEEFTPEQARRFLRERTALSDEAGARKLAAELGYLPLALAQAAALIVRRRLDHGRYLRLLRAFPLQRYLPAQAGDRYPTGTARAILLAVIQAEQVLPHARRMLEMLAVLSPAGVPLAILYGTPVDDPDDVDEQAELAREQIDEVLAELADTSLISFTEDGGTVLVHRLVQRVLRERARHDNRLQAVLADVTELLNRFDDALPDGPAIIWGARAAAEMLIEQTTALHAIAHNEDALTEPLLRLRAWCARYLTDLADLGRAIPLYEATLAEQERVLGADHPGTLISRHNLAGAYESAGDLGRALPLYEATLADCERVLGAEHPDTLTSRHNLAYTYKAAGDLGRAVPLYEATLAERERVLGGDHPDTLTSRHNLADAYQTAGDLGRAIPLFEATLAEQERVLGGEHPDTLTSRHNLAHAYQAAGDLSRAIPLAEATLAERERVLGADHPHTLASRHNLAYAYQAAGDLGRAIPLFEATLADCERVLGAEHPDTLTSRHNLADAYEAAGDAGRAIPLYEATLAERERVLGGDHPDTLTSRHNLAYAYEAAGDLGRAIPLYEATLAERERVLGGDHPDTLTSRHNLAYAYEAAGDLDRAIPLYEATLAERERVLGGDHPDTLTSRHNLAYAYESAGDPGRAIPLYEATLAGFERVLGADHPDTLTLRHNLAYAYESAGDPSRAIPLLEATLADCERVLGGEHPLTKAVREDLQQTQ
ncbi:tetratricopeptide repeat protein [Sphaerisporangium fuscum]|uniref:tetratricopeptide repeat protein n=1 Tax=Sphaerisporangium fuscum TaxID=2835868 RepID=UPI001BDD8F2A|nr:tetratricopeptide repeat protein [Sphaerisporangium fuscum]